MIDPGRSAAWRFLVPGGRRIQAVATFGGSIGAETLVDSGLAAAVATPGARAADLALAFADAGTPLETILQTVAPHGVLYIEVAPSVRSSVAARTAMIRSAAKASGFDRIATYSVEPNFETPEAFVGIDAPEPNAWFLRTRFIAGSWQHWLGAQTWQRLLSTTGSRYGFERQALVAAAAARWDDLPLAWRACDALLRSASSNRTVALLRGGDERVIVLPFAEGPEPSGVFKMSTHPAHNHRTINEQVLLDSIRSGLPAALAASLPQPQGLGQVDDLAVSWESALPGRLLSSSTRSAVRSFAQKSRDFVSSMDWLIAFHHQTADTRHEWDDSALSRWLEQPFVELTGAGDPSHRERALLDGARARAGRLLGRPLPMVWQHRDFNVWNVLSDGGRPATLDWEGATRGLPLCDAFQLAVSWIHAVEFPRDRLAEARAMAELFVSPIPASAAVTTARQELRRYLESFGIDRSFVAPLLIAHRVELINRRRTQGQSDRTLAEYPAFTTLAEHADLIFSDGWPDWP